MNLGEWQAHFIDTASILRKGAYSDPRGVRYQSIELPANSGAPLIVQDLEQLRYIFETEEPRLVEGLLAMIESIDLSLLQLANEEGRKFREFISSFQASNRPDYRTTNQQIENDLNYQKDKRFDNNKNYK